MDAMGGDRIDQSPVEKALLSLQAIDPKWQIDIGIPDDSPQWIRGTDLADANGGPFRALLDRIGSRTKTSDRKMIAAFFALRFGWAASAAIGPYLIHRCVPDIRLENISLRFREDTLFERTAIHSPSGAVLSNDPAAGHPLARLVDDPSSLLLLLRSELKTQAAPVVDAMYKWSGFSKKGAWGMVTSSWASLFVHVYERLGSQADALPVIQSFFQGADEVASMQPKLHPVTLGSVTHLYQRRASCCRYYLLPQGSLCASCPLVSQEERLVRNLEWMKKQLAREAR
jgi:ferric iron reductase protein FhuF